MENKIDLSELQRQREEYIKKQKRYCEMKILIGLGDETPYAHFETRDVTSFEHAMMLKCMDAIKNALIKRDPICKEIYERINVETRHFSQKIEGDSLDEK